MSDCRVVRNISVTQAVLELPHKGVDCPLQLGHIILVRYLTTVQQAVNIDLKHVAAIHMLH